MRLWGVFVSRLVEEIESDNETIWALLALKRMQRNSRS